MVWLCPGGVSVFEGPGGVEPEFDWPGGVVVFVWPGGVSVFVWFEEPVCVWPGGASGFADCPRDPLFDVLLDPLFDFCPVAADDLAFPGATVLSLERGLAFWLGPDPLPEELFPLDLSPFDAAPDVAV